MVFENKAIENHSNLTTGIHGVTGVIVEEAKSQSLTNKTIDTTNTVHGESDISTKLTNALKGIAYGTANRSYFPCIFIGDSASLMARTGFASPQGNTQALSNSNGTGASWLFFKCTAPCQLGDLGFYARGIRYRLNDADVNNYVDQIQIYYVGTDGQMDGGYSNTGDEYTIGQVSENNISENDCGSALEMGVAILINTDTVDALELGQVELYGRYG